MRNIEIAMVECIKEIYKDWEKNGEKEQKIEGIADRERNDIKVRGKKTMETGIMVKSPLTTGMPRKEQQYNLI